MSEIDYTIIFGIVAGMHVPTWTLIIWIMKVQRNGCERLSKMEGQHEPFEHSKTPIH